LVFLSQRWWHRRHFWWFTAAIDSWCMLCKKRNNPALAGEYLIYLLMAAAQLCSAFFPDEK